MNLKTLISEDGLPEIHISFDQDTSESEPYMVLKAYGMSVDEVAGTLMDVAQSLHNNIPVETVQTYEVYPETGKMTVDGEALLSQMSDMRRPGETVRDVERRLIRDGRLVGGKIIDGPAQPKPGFGPKTQEAVDRFETAHQVREQLEFDPQPKPRPFNPKPRGTR